MQLQHLLAPPSPPLAADQLTRTLIDRALFTATLEEGCRAMYQHARQVGADLAIACHAARTVDGVAIKVFEGPPPAEARRAAWQAVATEIERMWREACLPEHDAASSVPKESLE
jgi:hypothetical protein